MWLISFIINSWPNKRVNSSINVLKTVQIASENILCSIQMFFFSRLLQTIKFYSFFIVVSVPCINLYSFLWWSTHDQKIWRTKISKHTFFIPVNITVNKNVIARLFTGRAIFQNIFKYDWFQLAFKYWMNSPKYFCEYFINIWYYILFNTAMSLYLCIMWCMVLFSVSVDMHSDSCTSELV